MQKIRLIPLVLSFILLVGCIQTKVLDDIELIMAIGYDWNADNKTYTGTAIAPIFGASEDNADMGKNVQYTGEAKTFQEINARIQTQAPFTIEVGNLADILFGEALAKEGVSDILEGINEDPSIGRDLNLAVVSGNAEDLLKNAPILELTLSRFIEKLIKNNNKNNIPRMNLHDFNYRLAGEGMDPFLPIIQYSNTSVDIIGLALMKHDQFVDQLPIDQFFIFSLLYEDSKDHTYEFYWDEEKQAVSIGSIYSKHSIDWKSDNEVEIQVAIYGTLAESNQIGMQSATEKQRLEQAVSKDLEQKGKELTKFLQQLDIDPLMIGDSASNHFRDWDKEEWKKQYPKITITPNIDFNLEFSNIKKRPGQRSNY
ncbi:Ger(x)C family spore germination protein [Gracilibacillus sp. S3-1-1]|uniref:Ger(X)C family spore germination protein n=1 Tax=Gracilibacillus pellucidus TaxID=3095368 RepID=A0ACC6M1F4_9BACI|nr:Ger(x)C family spore germination protein [Gracilibacillus sp. S3-1-1]MDX8044708.1 Ger(x)C family spore germination protein [Gracilibacillus sp. S3-1-1]